MLALYTLTICVSALLLFSVQPMLTKMVLPLLGGAPAVWNTALVFFQAALLAGYAYTHVTARWLGARRQAWTHMVLLLLSLLALPVAVAAGWTPPAESNPIPWLVALLAVSVGAPFFMLAANAPMLQHWFAHSGHEAAANPYFLYAASNVGSMAALVAYPTVIEPFLRLGEQTWAWSGLYATLMALIAACAIVGLRRGAAPAGDASAPTTAPGATAQSDAAAPVTAFRRLHWVLLSFAPASLLLGITSFATTDVAAVPLLWVVPLAIYLLTFILVFARRPPLPHMLMVKVQPFVVLPLVLILWFPARIVLLPLHLLVFFVTTMVCHGELVRRRPSARHVTEFYLWLSLGGVLGGAFNGLLAPVVFDAVLEYPLALVLACLLRPRLGDGSGRYAGWPDFALPLAIFLVIAGSIKVVANVAGIPGMTALVLGSCFVGCVAYGLRSRPIGFGLGMGAIMLAGVVAATSDTELIHRERDFFGVHQVRRSSEHALHLLLNGTTVHGAQSLDPADRLVPLAYYHPAGPLGELFATRFNGANARRVAIVGLGTGSIACYGRPDESWTYYEIDPTVERIARDPRFFTYLRDCAPKIDVVLGDARLKLADAPAGSYDLIILDAFSSDAVPVHLLTREAFELYLDKLAAGGVLAFHISSRYLDLAPVLGNLAQALGLSGRLRNDRETAEGKEAARKYQSTWAVLARTPQDLGPLAGDSRWQDLPVQPGAGTWSDDFSNILAVFRWKLQ